MGNNPVDDLMLGCLERPPQERTRALQELCATHPEHADALRERFAALSAVGIDALAGDRARDFPEHLGEFRLIERLGGGGMGVVYRAEQTSLGREVALKLIRPDHLFFPRARERFQREVEAVARLQHPGIVPVYTVGEENGVPYFAMELLRGATLAEILTRVAGRAPESLSGADMAPAFDGSWVDASLDVARQMVEALAHAHERGILHRDVKPSNVVLTPEGRAMLLDFGLTVSEESAATTRTGSQLGTLPYMSPEQVAGRRADARTDVYALGVTLYELLTLQVPFGGDTRQAVEKGILAGRPDPIRARNRRVPVEAEVVCGKAMDLEPAQRYASAADLARDLDNALAKRPIEARPPGPLLRARRWVERHPARATALAATLLLVVGGPSALWLQASAHANELSASLDETNEQLRRFEEVREFLVELFAVADPDAAQGREITASEILARGVLDVRGKLADQPRTRAALLAVLARVHRQLGLYREARPLYEEAVELLRDVPADRENLGVVQLGLAKTLSKLADYEGAHGVFEELLATRRAALGPDDPRVADVLVSLGQMLSEEQRFEEAEEHLREAVDIVERAAEPDPLQLANALGTLGTALLNHAQLSPERLDVSNYVEAEAHLLEARGLLEEAGVADTIEYANVVMNLGLALKHQERWDEAEECYRLALERFRLLVGDNDRTAGALQNLSGLLWDQGQAEEALAPMRESAELFAKLFDESHPSAVLALGNLANALATAGRWDEAEEVYGRLIPLQIAIHGEDHIFVAFSRARLGHCLLEREAWAEAEPYLLEGLAGCQGFYGPDFPQLVHIWADLATLYEATGRPEKAAEARERLEALAGIRS